MNWQCNVSKQPLALHILLSISVLHPTADVSLKAEGRHTKLSMKEAQKPHRAMRGVTSVGWEGGQGGHGG